MTPTSPVRLILASGSPRRHRLLRSIGLELMAVAPDIDESPRAGEDPVGYVERLAREKVAAVPAGGDDVVLAADTTVALDGEILGKPIDAEDARRMLRALSGRSHDVHTGVAVRAGGRTRAAVATTRVTMTVIGEDELDWYVGTGEPLDKAGAYALQEGGGLLVAGIEGSASNVVGLPLAVVAELLAEAGFPLVRLRGGSVPS
jgi:septum formation protein